MKLQVPLTMAARLWTWLAASAKPRAWTIGIPPPTLPSKATARRAARGLGEDLGAVLGQKGFVGRDDVLAGREGRQHVLERRLDPAHGFDDDLDFGIVDELAGRRW